MNTYGRNRPCEVVRTARNDNYAQERQESDVQIEARRKKVLPYEEQ